MSELPYLVKDLALILIVAGIVTIVFKKLKQPLVLGYVVAGFLVSPHMPYTMSVVDRTDIGTWGDIGVMFLLFSLGLDFSFKKIMRMGASPVIATCSVVFCMVVLGIVAGHAFGWSRMDCIFLGGMLAMSSTTIIYKAFDDLGLRQQRFAGLVMSVLILEDILAIVMMVMLSAIAAGSNPAGGQMIGSVLKIAFFLILWFVVGIFLIPWMLRSMRKLINNETLLIVSLGLCCAMAVLSTQVGFSSAFGAFVMGSILAETIEADSIIKLVEPVKNLFGATFSAPAAISAKESLIPSFSQLLRHSCMIQSPTTLRKNRTFPPKAISLVYPAFLASSHTTGFSSTVPSSDQVPLERIAAFCPSAGAAKNAAAVSCPSAAATGMLFFSPSSRTISARRYPATVPEGVTGGNRPFSPKTPDTFSLNAGHPALSICDVLAMECSQTALPVKK